MSRIDWALPHPKRGHHGNQKHGAASCGKNAEDSMSKGFNWDDLQSFIAVARAGTVLQASHSMGVDHATIVRRLDSLEQALGTKLFERNPRGYNLTQRGERLLVLAQNIEAETQKAERDIAGADLVISGVVRINSLEGFANFFLAARLPHLVAEHPDLTIELVAIQQILALSRREADIAITLYPPESGRFVRERLTDYALFVFGTKPYLANAPPIRSRNDLQNHPFTGYIDDLIFMRGLDYLDEIGARRPRLQSSSLHAQMEAALAGYGLCVLPAFIATQHKTLLPVLPREVFLRRTYWLVMPADTADTARVQVVRCFIQKEAVAAQAVFLNCPRQ
jgi:DNA-binding transcriptional LysR family regulator